ncbi:ectoine/hydroxyectoine ABC transporter permease subunit EhuD [Mesorhizobium sp. M0088]|uniref:ectoine/hydroxyectoine ABC transporter permease subunit EhuD n=1 Tax=Mesorhizobium sp. M0088 TaxID=2956873 RepID=UPI00333872EB
MFNWDWEFTWQILPRLLSATGNTVIAALLGYLIAMALGLVFTFMLRTRSQVITVVAREIIDFIRSTPLLVQVFFVFYVGPQFGIRVSPWAAGMFAIGVHYACYLSEVYRGGIDAVARGQFEAATALNMSAKQTYFRIILPQAFPLCIPGMGNYLIGIFKDTPMLSVIGVAELTHAANSIGGESYRFLEPFTLVGLIFLVISLPSAGLVKLVDSYVRRRQGI